MVDCVVVGVCNGGCVVALWCCDEYGCQYVVEYVVVGKCCGGCVVWLVDVVLTVWCSVVWLVAVVVAGGIMVDVVV